MSSSHTTTLIGLFAGVGWSGFIFCLAIWPWKRGRGRTPSAGRRRGAGYAATGKMPEAPAGIRFRAVPPGMKESK